MTRFLTLMALMGLSPSLLSAQNPAVVNVGDTPAWANPTLVEDLRFGSFDGSPDYTFGSIRYVVPTKDGRMFVGDAQGPRLKLYSEAGEFLRDVGSYGEGPGEFTGIFGMDLTPDDELALYDLSTQRISFFDSDGEFRRSFQVNTGGSWRGSRDFLVEPDGNMLIYTVRHETFTDSEGRTIGIEAGASTPVYYQRVSPEGEVLDSLKVPVPTDRQRAFVLMAPEGNLRPFTTTLEFAVSPLGYIWSGRPSDYRLSRLDRLLETDLVLEKDHETVRLLREERNLWQHRADLITTGFSAGVQIPSEKPAFRSIEVDEEGRLWVNRYVTAVKRPPDPNRSPDLAAELIWREPPTFDVIEPTGSFLGTVTTPWRTRILFRRGNQLWGVYRGDFDEHYVVRFRLDTGN